MALAEPPAGEGMERLRAICAQLRRHCPWDAEQTLESVPPLVLEEGEELRQAVLKSDWDNLREEVGDVLFNLLLTVQIAEEQGLFTWDDVLEAEAAKMIHRHPHVYADAEVSTPEAAIDAFNRMKSLERSTTGLAADSPESESASNSDSDPESSPGAPRR